MGEKTWFFIIGLSILLFCLYQQYKADKEAKKVKFLVEQYIIMMLTLNLLREEVSTLKKVDVSGKVDEIKK